MAPLTLVCGSHTISGAARLLLLLLLLLLLAQRERQHQRVAQHLVRHGLAVLARSGHLMHVWVCV